MLQKIKTKILFFCLYVKMYTRFYLSFVSDFFRITGLVFKAIGLYFNKCKQEKQAGKLTMECRSQIMQQVCEVVKKDEFYRLDNELEIIEIQKQLLDYSIKPHTLAWRYHNLFASKDVNLSISVMESIFEKDGIKDPNDWLKNYIKSQIEKQKRGGNIK